ncbi:carboxypeptidase-like regulatory domain-containing protein [Thiomicrorhabdus sp. zzn3]|uniref:carboxypeptidase-like regulatory domain-containing protein n=1 Tax=Thiomicrorhabdus sp. zzn3 TaxID=3039775 RepID=UPI0024371FE1|nr:carboxypeptidase-like regulatory domain-containing protein [Thiomicrorhabdus sp. zzn3]MDG6777114.1 carboxypeptidase-like regulatory domain-containing protein [Thiomicrorhabdus sp. zzn3]
MNKNTLIHLFSVPLLSLALYGCGGGSSSSDQNPPQTSSTYSTNDDILDGTVAIGAPIAGASISIRDANGTEVSSTADANGDYSASVSGMTAPFFVRAEDPNSSLVLFSYADDDSGANVTPITTILLSNALPSGNSSLEAFYQTFTQTQLNTLQTQLETALQTLNTAIQEEGFTDFNHFNGVFTADSTGYDGILDNLNIRVIDSSVMIPDTDGTPLVATADVSQMYDNDNNVTATVSGLVTIGATGTGVSTATIQATDISTGEVYSAASDETGTFSLQIPRFAVYDVTITADGYQTVSYENLSTFSASSNVSVALIPVIGSDETVAVTFNANVIDATTGDSAIEQASVSVRAGLNNQYGEVLATSTSDTSGNVSFSEMAPGVYTFEVSKDGYFTSYKNIAVTSTIATQTLFLRPELNTGNLDTAADMSIILTWDQNPSDLDSHLTGPKVNALDDNDRFHIAYYEQCWADSEENADANCTSEYDEVTYQVSYPNATAYLDRDDTTSYGPETTTIYQMIPGEYNFYVHHYSGTGSISTTSAAQVFVVDKFGQSHTFNAPITGGNGDDDIWHVFTTDNAGNIIPVNTFVTDTDSTQVRSNLSNTENIRSKLADLPEKN